MDYRDPWTWPPELGAQGDRTLYQSRMFSWLEERLIRAASAVTVVTPTWLHELRMHFDPSGNQDKFQLIRNGHDLPDEGDGSPLVSEERCGPKRLRIHFNGTIQTGNNVLDLLPKALDRLQMEGLDYQCVHFSFCGLPDEFIKDVNSGPFVVCFADYGPLSHEESLARCREADALLVTVRSNDASTLLWRNTRKDL